MDQGLRGRMEVFLFKDCAARPGASLLGNQVSLVETADLELSGYGHRLPQFCCKMRFSSSSAERNKNAADSRYPATSCLTALISVGLS